VRSPTRLRTAPPRLWTLARYAARPQSGRRPEPAEALGVPLRDPRPKQATGTVGRLPTCPNDSAGASDQIERATLPSLQWTWATAARKDCHPDRRARQDLQLRTSGRPQRRSRSIRVIDDPDLHLDYARRSSSISSGCSRCPAVIGGAVKLPVSRRHWPGTEDGFTAATRPTGLDRPTQ
jgi:hypothetical protein